MNNRSTFFSYCGALDASKRQSIVRQWQEDLTLARIPFKENFIPHMMTPLLRMNVSKGEATVVKENLAFLCTLQSPLLIIDPVQVALEYLELYHIDEKMALLHIGDPEFKDQYNLEAKDADVVIVLHAVLSLGKFHSQVL